MKYPNAEWVPWKHESSQGPTYYKGTNKPEAVVLHIAQGYASTARSWALSGHYGASWHYTVAKDGTIMQHLDHTDGGYHAGIPDTAPAPAWSLWKGKGINVNTYTIGIEHEGFSGDGFTAVQAAASRDLCRWLAVELGFPYSRANFPPHADIDLINRPNDFGPPAYRAAHYQFMFGDDDMGMSDNDILAVFGSTERDANGNLDPVARLAAAKARYQAAIDTGHSPFDVSSQAIAEIREHVKNHSAGVVGPIPTHDHPIPASRTGAPK